MKTTILPALWLLILLVGLPQFSETVYTPSFPSIAHDFKVSIPLVEYTLTIYLLGFTFGVLFWGRLSDYLGRKPCVVFGLLVFILGCVGCYLSNSIFTLMIARFVQAFGGSVGSVMGHIICRDAFYGRALGKVYSVISSSLAIFPAVGPIFGGLVVQFYTWHDIFLLLIIFGGLLVTLIILYLPETHHKENRESHTIKKIFLTLIKDKKVICYALIVGSSNGAFFSYFSEGSFCLIEFLHLSPSNYGLSFLAIAASTFCGGMLSKKLHDYYDSQIIMRYGLKIFLFGGLLSSIGVLSSKFISVPLIAIILISQMIITCGNCIISANASSIALVDYKWCFGTASSFFGFFYYLLISMITFGMALLHNGTLFPMPLYFLGLGIFINVIDKFMIQAIDKQNIEL